MNDKVPSTEELDAIPPTELFRSKYVDIAIRYFPPESAAEAHTALVDTIEALQAMADRMVPTYGLDPKK